MNYVLKVFRYIKYKILRMMYRSDTEFLSARESLLRSDELSDEEKAMLKKVSLKTHFQDEMYRPTDAQHYLSVGLSAIRCIEHAMHGSKRAKPISSVLDFPCGHGRVLRFLKARFADADIFVSEINPMALDFCKREFGVKSVISNKDFGKVSLSGKIDLIWSGSLLTHLDEHDAAELLKFFHETLSPEGLCIFTTHGRHSASRMVEMNESYGLTENSQRELLTDFNQSGYGYSDYRFRKNYGISVVSHDRMLAIARSVGQWDETGFVEQGWDNHQDVYCFTKTESTVGERSM